MVTELNALDAAGGRGGSGAMVGEGRRAVLDSLFVDRPADLAAVARSEARVFLLYSTHREAIDILR